MYVLGFYRDLIENYIQLTSSCKSNPHKTRDSKGEEREGTRDSWTMLCLPDHRGRQVPMDQSCRLLYICLAAHAEDVEAERTSTLITNDTMAMWTGLGHSQLSEAKAKLRNTGWIASEKRSHTSNRTWMYRRPGSWDQQRYDEAKSEAKAKLRNPAEEVDEGSVTKNAISVSKTTKVNKKERERTDRYERGDYSS